MDYKSKMKAVGEIMPSCCVRLCISIFCTIIYKPGINLLSRFDSRILIFE